MDNNIHYLKWSEFSKTLEGKKLETFTIPDLHKIFKVKPDTLKRFLSRHTQGKNLIRLKRGLYSLEKTQLNDFTIAQSLYSPSYISLEFAMSYYSIIPETVYAITSVTAKPTREFRVLGKIYSYHKIKKEAYGGYIPRSAGEASYFMATPDKVLADFLYFVFLCRKKMNDRIDWSKVNKDEVRRILITEFGIEKKSVRKLLL